MSELCTKHQATFGATLTAALLHRGDDDPKEKKPYAVTDTYFIEFEGEPEDLLKAIAKLPMVEQVFTMEIKREIPGKEE